MPDDPGIICFRHCSPRNIFCKSVPTYCPICSCKITNFSLDPFSIPYPYTNAAHHPTSLVIKPSYGTFLKHYNLNSDLHIGITNSRGIVTEFDKQGIIINNHSKWGNCIASKVVPSAWDVHWDDQLQIMQKDSKWNSCNYHETTMNCFTFVKEFINNLNYKGLVFNSKEELCKALLLSKIQEAVKYNAIFKNLEDKDCYV